MSSKRTTSRTLPARPMTYRKRVHPLTNPLWAEMDRQRMTFCRLAERSGVAEDTLYAWRRGVCPNVGYLEACLNVVGLTLAVVERQA